VAIYDFPLSYPEARDPIPEARFTPQGGENPVDFGKKPVLEKTVDRGCFFPYYFRTPFSLDLL
jgi:hypothetical protein